MDSLTVVGLLHTLTSPFKIDLLNKCGKMSQHYNETPNSFASTSPEHIQYYNRDRNSCFPPPPPLPPLPPSTGGQAIPPPRPGEGFQGFAPHSHVRSPAKGGSFANEDAKKAALPRRCDDDDASLSQANSLGLDFADSSPTVNRHHYNGGPFERHSVTIPPSSLRNSLCTSQMPSVYGSWTGTPNDAIFQERSSLSPPSVEIGENGPYYRDAPSLLGAGSGSSEYSSASSSSVAATKSRPVPAKSAFMCFCEAKGTEFSTRNAVSPPSIFARDYNMLSHHGQIMFCPQEKGGFVEAVAVEWRSLPPHKKAYWEGIAANEKARFVKERDALCKTDKGPLARKLRAKKDPVSKRKIQP
jgi:hypothetical protein